MRSKLICLLAIVLLRAAGMPEEVHDAITGHTGAGIGRTYGRVPLKTVHEVIQHVHYEGLGLNWEWKKLAVQRVRRTTRVAGQGK